MYKSFSKNSQFQFHGDFKIAKERCLIIKIPSIERKHLDIYKMQFS